MIDEIGYVLWGLAFGFALSAPVGPVNIICLRRSLFGRARDGFMIGLGASAGDAFYAGLAALGLKAFLSVIDSFDTELKLIGATIMIVFAIRIWRSHPHIDQSPQEGGVKRGMLASLVLTLTNPGVFFGFLGLYALAGIGDLGADGGYIHSDAIALIVGVFLGSSLWWATLVGIGRYLRDKVNDKFLSIINHFSAALIGLFALGAILSIWLKF
ncbi:LysE family translocator [Kordiimonas sp.]|uniref:LysE family translocator n=1 Tax=Kordiimonas sp. TaxID=1970157 RepID=UPI003A95CF87